MNMIPKSYVLARLGYWSEPKRSSHMFIDLQAPHPVRSAGFRLVLATKKYGKEVTRRWKEDDGEDSGIRITSICLERFRS
jgi:hypothetical protein